VEEQQKEKTMEEEVFNKLQEVDQQTGVMILSAGGEILKSSGELKDSKYAKSILQMVLDTKGLLESSQELSKQALHRVIVSFKERQYAITVASNLIFVVQSPTH